MAKKVGCRCSWCREQLAKVHTASARRKTQDTIADLVVEAAAEREPMTCDGFGCAFCNDDAYDAALVGHAPLTVPLGAIARAA